MRVLFLVTLVPLFWVAMTALARVAWNCVVPSLFHGPAIGFWQTAALLFLVSLAVGSLRSVQRRS